MSIESGLYDTLLADPAVSALVEPRIYPVVLPQSPAYPAISFTLVAPVREHSHGGSTGLVRSRFQIDCWAATHDGMVDLADKVRLALVGQTGIWGGVTVQGVMIDGMAEFFEQAPEVWRRAVDVGIWHSEAKPA